MKHSTKTFLTFSATALLLAGCGTTPAESEKSAVTTSETTTITTSEKSEAPSTTTSEEPSIDYSTLDYVDDLLWFPDLKLEVNQKQYVGNYLLEYEDAAILVPDKTAISYDGKYLVPQKEGDTYIVYSTGGKYQKVNINVAKEGTYDRAYTFEEENDAGALAGKRVINFGDSVSCDWTVGDNSSIYVRRFAAHYDMVMDTGNWTGTYDTGDNRALGGTVCMPGAKNANVKEEYNGTEYMTNDGCDNIYNMRKDGSLAKYDYLFLTYGYNDCYFQPDTTAEGDDAVCDDNVDPFANCTSYRGYFRNMIDNARLANPNIKIVIMNIIYNQYTLDDGYYQSNYHFDKGIKYLDYRKCLFDIGYEKDVKVIDMWNYTKSMYDWERGRESYEEGEQNGVYYRYIDEMHPSKIGNKYMAKNLYLW